MKPLATMKLVTKNLAKDESCNVRKMVFFGQQSNPNQLEKSAAWHTISSNLEMDQGIKILFLEDDPADVARVENELRKNGLVFQLQRTDTREGFLSGLNPPPDVILSDHGLPAFDGLTAFATAREKCPDVPFIFVTNALTREMEIEKLLGGIADYVRKSELDYLGIALRHALREAKEGQLRKDRVKNFFKQAVGHEEELLPICSNCKKIRNKHNYWQPLEIFFLENFDIRFTHGICPDCSTRFFSRAKLPSGDVGDVTGES
jgi:CheY-like chemotaxis protein